MQKPSTNITSKYSQKTHYNYAKNSVFFASNCSPLLCYRSVTTALTAQIPAETLSQTHRVCFIRKERDSETGFSYFGARYYDSDLMTGWLSVDPMADKYPSLSPYAYCHNNPIKLIDPDGKKDKPFRFLIDKYVSIILGTETPIEYKGRTHPNFENAYNCHSYAWHDSKGDINPGNKACYPDIPTQNGVPLSKWDNNPADDIIEQGAIQLDVNDNNIPGDRVIYYFDANKDGIYTDGEYISHSAIVKAVDKNGCTTLVISKMGDGGISENHPRAPKFYKKDTDPCSGKTGKLSRAYFRLPKIEDIKNE